MNYDDYTKPMYKVTPKYKENYRYLEKGYDNRRAYLDAVIAEVENDMPELENAALLVNMTAELLGPEEDFDGLLSMIADYTGYIPQV